jgi:hypothetical protein
MSMAYGDLLCLKTVRLNVRLILGRHEPRHNAGKHLS